MRSAPLVTILVGIALAGCVVDRPPPDGIGDDDGKTPGLPDIPQQLAWRAMTPLPGALGRAEHGVALVGSKFYIIGGFLIPPTNFDVPDTASQGVPVPTDRVDVYDAASDSWREAQPYPVELDHAPAVAYDGLVYVFHGAQSFRYDPEADTWTRIADVPDNHNAGIAALDGDRIWVAAGRTTTAHAYDPSNDTWQEATSQMTIRRDHTAGGFADGKLFVVAGDTAGHSQNTGSVEAYDPVTGTWSDRAPLPTVRGSLAGVSWLGRIVVMGGQSGPDEFADVDLYDPVADRWSKLPPMPTTRHGFGAGVWNGAIYVFAGAPYAGVTGFNEVHALRVEQTSSR